MLAAMTDAIAYRGPDGRGQWSEGPAALSHLMLRTTPESLDEIQPLANEDASRVLVMDGWLANWAELRTALLARGAVLRTASDAELVLRAYETWGDSCHRHLEGEYCFVLWDVRKREAVCAKDHAGMRPLHYHWNGRRLLVASDIAGVLAAGDFEQRPNLGMVAEHLSNEWYGTDDTLWAGVMRLLPAHFMRVGANGPSFERHWQPPLEVSIHHRNDEDYQQHYRAVFADCVRRASRSHKPVACDVSGGHDSSGIFAMAFRLAEAGELPAPEICGYTYSFGDDVEPENDEIGFARAVGAHLGAKIHEIPAYLPDLDWFGERGRADRDMALYPNAALAVSTGIALVADGCVVQLNGEGGDEFLAETYPLNYAEHLAKRDWGSLGQSLREDFAAFGTAQTLRDVLRYGAGPNVPASFRTLRRGLRRKPPLTPGRKLLTPEMLRLLDERRLASEKSLPARTRDPARRGMFMNLEYGCATYVRDFASRLGARLGHDVRSPMYARQFLEFAFALPERQRRRGDFQKYIHLSALAADLPKALVERRTKSEFSQPFLRQLDNARTHVLPRMLQRGNDWINSAALSDFYSYCDRQPRGMKPVYEPWAIYGCVNLFD